MKPNAGKSVLTRDSGPSGWTDLPTGRYELDGWELFEGDPASPHMCRGWFRCRAAGFKAAKNTALRLHLTSRTGDDRILDVRITHVSRTDPDWEFVAER